MYVDADAHVDECEDTWCFMPKEFVDELPRTVAFTDDNIPPWLGWNRSSTADEPQKRYRFWFIDGQLFINHLRSDERTGTTEATRTLRDIPGRLAHMDALGIELQTVYSSLFLAEVSERQELVAALYHSYNRWLSERCAESNGRLHWIAMIPFAHPEAARRELEYAKEGGACGAFKRTTEAGRSIADPVFLPLYDVAEKLDLAICVHQNREWTPIAHRLSAVWMGDHDSTRYPVLIACANLLDAKIPDRFPNLRFGMIESASSWLPFVLRHSRWDFKKGWAGNNAALADSRIFVTCEADEDLPYLIRSVGGDTNLMVGTDYSHADNSSNRHAHQMIAQRSDLPALSAKRITNENARALYGLS